MNVVLASVVAVVVAAGLGRVLGERLAASSPIMACNYRGLEVPAAGGMAVVLATFAGIGAAMCVAALGARRGFGQMAGVGIVGTGAVLGYGLLGLWDDLTPSGERGWATHLRALRAGRPTGGAVKLAGGTLLGVTLASATGGALWEIVLRGALIALSANLVNLLDLRPGRAGKFALVLALGPLVAAFVGGDRVAVLVLAAGAATAAFLPFDLRERAMLGDVGANAIGGVLGVATVAVSSTGVQALLVAVLLALHAAADRPGLSGLIAAVPPFSSFDRLGRVPDRN